MMPKMMIMVTSIMICVHINGYSKGLSLLGHRSMSLRIMGDALQKISTE